MTEDKDGGYLVMLELDMPRHIANLIGEAIKGGLGDKPREDLQALLGVCRAAVEAEKLFLAKGKEAFPDFHLAVCSVLAMAREITNRVETASKAVAMFDSASQPVPRDVQ